MRGLYRCVPDRKAGLWALIALLTSVIAALGIAVFASPAYAEGETISGTMIVSQTDKPVSGVKVTVTNATTQQLIGTAESGKDGRYTVPLPGPGTYTVTLDTDTLPENISLVDESKTIRTVIVDPNSRGAVAFRLSDGSSVERQQQSRFLQLLFEGVRFGLVIAITAIGLSLIFGTTGLTNFAHGELVAFGAFAAWWVNTSYGVALWLAALFAIVVGGLLGAGNELGIWRPLRRRRIGLVAMLVGSIGLSLLLRNLLLMLVGGSTEFYNVPAETEIDLGLISATPRDLIAMALCAGALVAVAVMLQKTTIGKAMRAVADNRDLAESSGINVDRVILVVWILGGALAAFGGVIYGWTLDLRFDMGFTLLLLMFAGVTLGGLGTAYGALVGSVLIGIIVQLSTLVIPNDVKYGAGLAVLIIVLLVRPSGLLGARQRIG